MFHDILHVNCMIPCSLHVKCHAHDVPWYFTYETHIHSWRETWSMQTRGMNLYCLCHLSLCVHACKNKIINERYHK